MASSGSVFSETLQSVTNTKLEELSKKRAKFEEQSSALQDAAQAEQDPLRRLLLLVDGVRSCFGVTKASRRRRTANKRDKAGHVTSSHTNHPRLETDLKDLDRFLEQARFDLSISTRIMGEWERTLMQHLTAQALKYQYATLYGQLVTEWLSSESKLDTSSDDDMGTSEAFEEIPGAKKLESRAVWERSVFEPYEIDETILKSYLNDLFGTHGSDKQDVMKALNTLHTSVEQFESALAAPQQFNRDTLKWTIQGLLSSDLLSDEKRAVLKDFLGNDIILTEIADVLNMRMTALDASSWSWGGDVPVEQRRKLNGSYNIHLHEDLLQAVFLQFLGVKWSVFFKRACRAFRRNKVAWKSLRKTIPVSDQRRRNYYLGVQTKRPSVQSRRRSIYRKNYFLAQLPDSEFQNIEIEEGDEEAELEEDEEDGIFSHRTKQTARKAGVDRMACMQPQMAPRLAAGGARRARYVQTDAELERSEESDSDSDSDAEQGRIPKRPMDAKQRLLHLLSTEIAINTRIYGDVTCFRSVFEQWNALLPHTTILTVLSFFGVSQKWLSFFQKFLQAPLKFIDENCAASRIRRRGTPGSHSLSDFFGEAVLFCLDFAINQYTNGSLLHRMYDEFWFWSPKHSTCVRAWQTVSRFTEVMGVTLTQAKTGTIRIGRDTSKRLEIDRTLPEGQIRWGFLHLDPKTGRFEIDQSLIDSHIEELRRQLQDKNRSIFTWIQAWNTYATTFFTTNFGKPANCFGREHVDSMLATHKRIHGVLFSSEESVVEHLKNTIKERFGIEGIPDGFLFFPIELGGLDLQSPFIRPLLIRDAVLEHPSDLLDQFEEAEREAYRAAKLRFERGQIQNQLYTLNDPDLEPAQGKDIFMSFEEFTRYREEFSYGYENQLSDVFDQLLEWPTEEWFEASEKVKTGQAALNRQTHLRGILGDWYSMEPYWRWVAQLYGPEMIDRFGGLNIVDPGLLPTGMVSLFRNKRVKWQG